MNALFLVFYSIVQFQSVTSLQCYKCKASNEESCIKRQTLIDCEEDKNGACMTLSYDIKKGTGFESNYRKVCSKQLSDCFGFCSRYALKNCKVSCCTDDFCNRRVVREVIKDNQKRSTKQKSATCKIQLNLTLMLTAISFVMFRS